MVNKVMLIGRLGNTPEIRYTLDGKPVATFKIATNEVIIRNGEKEILTEWHRIVTFGRLAEICGEYLSKGSQVYVEGSLRTRKFEDREGRERFITEIIASKLHFLDIPKQKKEPKIEDSLTPVELNIAKELEDEEDLPF